MTGIEWTPILVALIGAGLLKYAADLFKWLRERHRASSPLAVRATEIATVDQSLAVVARARDELAEDNIRLREEIARSDRRTAEQQARHDAEIARRDLREKAMRDEIDALERKLRALLSEVERLKDRHTFDEVETRRSRSHGTQFPGPQGA